MTPFTAPDPRQDPGLQDEKLSKGSKAAEQGLCSRQVGKSGQKSSPGLFMALRKLKNPNHRA